MLDFLLFRRMVTPLLLAGVFYFGLALTWFYCIRWFQAAPAQYVPVGLASAPGGSQLQVDTRLGIFAVALGASLALRVVVEAFLVVFRISESLTSVNKQARAMRDELAALASSLRQRPPA